MQATHFVVEDAPLLDSNTGNAGSVVMHYTGTCRLHPWASRKGEMVMDGRGVARMVNGDVYEGDVRLGMFEGQGKMTYANGDVYDGEWHDHLQHGYGIFHSKQRGTVYVGLFRNGEKDGVGEEADDKAKEGEGASFAGLFRNGKRTGVGRVKLADGTVVDGVFVEGELHGRCTVTYTSGDVFVGAVVNGVIHGSCEYTQVDTGDKFIERFEHGVCVQGVLGVDEDPSVLPQENPVDGCESESFEVADRRRRAEEVKRRLREEGKDSRCCVVYAATGDRYEGSWLRTASGANRRGLRHGSGTLTHASGDVYVGQFENDAKEGSGTLLLADHFRVERIRELEARRGAGQVVLDEDIEAVAKFWFVADALAALQSHHDTARGALQSSPGLDLPPLHAMLAAIAPFPLRLDCDFHNDLLHGKAKVQLSDGSVVEEFYCKGLKHGISHLHPARPRFAGEIVSALFDEGHRGDVPYHNRSSQSDDVSATDV